MIKNNVGFGRQIYRATCINSIELAIEIAAFVIHFVLRKTKRIN